MTKTGNLGYQFTLLVLRYANPGSPTFIIKGNLEMWSEMLKPECVYQFVDIETGEICCNHFEVMGWKCRPDGCKYILDETND